MAQEKDQADKEFKILKCGEVGSELLSIDKIIKNVTDQIQDGISGKKLLLFFF